MRILEPVNDGEGEIIVGEDVQFGKNITINVSERLVIGPRSVIGDYAIIEGRDIELGTEFWSDRYIQIGGGSCFEKLSSLKIGYWGHIGKGVFINTARPVTIGDEVGLGTETKLYTHGAYLSALEGFPVVFAPITIGSRVWIPGATVLPGVTIGPDTVVGVGSVVTKDLPGGCLAMGVPARVIKTDAYPNPLTVAQIAEWFNQFMTTFPEESYWFTDEGMLVNSTLYDFEAKAITGPANPVTERIKNELRRHGVRFKSYPRDGVYVPWEE